MKTILNVFSSLKVTILLLGLFAVSIAVATFIENDYGTETAWALIFKAKWFELLQLLLILNLLINIINFKMFTLKKLSILFFHISFVFILIGSALTRYSGYEGMMSIREGQTENRMLSTDSFLQIKALKNGKKFEQENVLYLSKLGGNDFSYSLDIDGKKVDVKYKKFIKNATKTLVDSQNKNATQAIKFILSSAYGPEEYILKDNSMVDMGMIKLFFNKKVNTNSFYINIYNKGEKLYFKSNRRLSYVNMSDQIRGYFKQNIEYPFELEKLYYSNSFQLVPKEYKKSALVKVEPKNETFLNKNEISALVVDVTYENKTQEIGLFGKGKQFKGYTENINLNKDTSLSLEWGAKIIKLPFSIKLKDFILDKYAGSQSPSSYESDVILLDNRKNLKMDYKIYMNHTLQYDGFTFYQSSYDKDEKGTVLSVNNDPGKWPTYLGYFLLIFGLTMNFINPNSRFFKLAKTKYIQATKITSLLVFTLFLSGNTSSYAATYNDNNSINKNTRAYINTLTKSEFEDYIKKIDIDHAELFGSILIQSRDGRIQPIDTYALNAINKITRGKNIYDLEYIQVFVGMVTRSKYWQKVNLFNVKHSQIKQILGINKNEFSYLDVFTKDGKYKFLDAANEAHRMKPSNRGKFEKEIIKIDERLNVAYNIFEGEFFTAFPLKNDKSNKWYSPKKANITFMAKDKKIIQDIIKTNIKGLKYGYESNNWAIANEALLKIIQYQNKNSNIIPNENLINGEILYNKLDIFNRIYPVYLLCGLFLLSLIFIRLLRPTINLSYVIKVIFVILAGAFILHTFNLALRWYIADHAPWSNSYEAMLYISWTIMLAGLLFSKHSDFALSSTGLFSGITLFVAHLSWLDPQITNLVPVLKSYWLTIHVSVITASYGFLGLSAMLGFITLILFIMLNTKNEQNKELIILNIKESVRINELSLTLGLALLIAGNFLGAIWANESWGRYWGWDPKETWTLVTVLAYALILHIRYVPKFSNAVFLFSTLSLLAYSTVIMTYFGVNYYLTGLHSYASGDPVPVPSWVYYSLGVIFTIILIAFKTKNEIAKYKIIKKGD